MIPRMRLLLLSVLGLGLLVPAHAQRQTLMLSQLAWFDRSGTRLATVGPLADHGNVELSPTGTDVASAVSNRATGTRDVWVYRADGTTKKLTSSALDENWMVWSSDGRSAIVNRFGPDGFSLLDLSSTDPRAPRTLLTDDVPRWPVSLSPDGRHLLYVTNDPRTGNDIWVLPLSGSAAAYPFQRTEATENWATFSPDGRFVAFSSNESGTARLFVTPFPGPGPRWPVSPDTGTQARWRRPNELIYVDGDRRLTAVTLDIGPDRVRTVAIAPLFTIAYPYGSYHAFDVTTDGTRLLVNTVVVSATGPSSNAFDPGRETDGSLHARR